MIGSIMRSAIVLLALVLASFLGGERAVAATMEIISVTNDGNPGIIYDWRRGLTIPDLSDDGRFAVFSSVVRLTPEDTDNYADIYLRDRQTGTTRLLTPPGFYGAFGSFHNYPNPAISGDGKHVAFPTGSTSGLSGLFILDLATNAIDLVAETTSYNFDLDYDGDTLIFVKDDAIYKHDRTSKETTLVYAPPYRLGSWYFTSVNRDGNLICFSEVSYGKNENLIYLYDLNTGHKELISKTQDGTPITGFHPKLSNSGDYVVFHSLVPNPYPNNTGCASCYQTIFNLFLYDVRSKTVERVVLNHPEYGDLVPSRQGYTLNTSDISDDGRYITTSVTAPTFNSNAPYSQTWAAVLDRQTGEVEFLPEGFPTLGWHLSITPDGRNVIGMGDAWQVILFDRQPQANFIVDAGPDQAVEQDSPFGAYAILNGQLVKGSCADSTFEWTWDLGSTVGETPTVKLPAGTTVVTLAWAGCGGTAEDTVSVTVADTTPPTATVDFLGTSGQNNWYVSPVTAAISAGDFGSGVQDIRYSINGGAEVVDPGVAAQATLNYQGPNTLSFYAIDTAGNLSTPGEQTVLIDSIAPTSSAQLSGKLNNQGIYVTEVAVQLQGADVTSGMQAIYYNLDATGWQLLDGDAVNLSVVDNSAHNIVFYAIDSAGNSGMMQTVSFIIDQSLLGQTITEEISDLVPSIPTDAFLGNNPNYSDKLASELNKVLAQLYAIDDSLSPAEKIKEYEWAKMKLETKILDEFHRMIEDPSILPTIDKMIADAVAGLDKVIVELNVGL